MIFTVSTIKTTPAEAERFVSANLASGVDHMFVFLDADQPAVQALLERNEHVTCVRTDPTWWQGERPQQLNARQTINANLVNNLLAEAGLGDWLFSIDADEVAVVPREALATLGAQDRVAHLEVLEAVSRKSWGDEEPTQFKRMLEKRDLTMLHVLGAISAPTNEAYFRGHVAGKAGLRPSRDLKLALHNVRDRRGDLVPGARHPDLKVLHYESYSGEEFVRKWTALVGAGPLPGFRAARRPTAVALNALLSKGLSEVELRPYLERVFELTALDDHQTLSDLRLLEEHRPRDGSHQPAPLSAEQRQRVEDLLGEYRSGSKLRFRARPEDEHLGSGRPGGARPTKETAAALSGRVRRKVRAWRA